MKRQEGRYYKKKEEEACQQTEMKGRDGSTLVMSLEKEQGKDPGQGEKERRRSPMCSSTWRVPPREALSPWSILSAMTNVTGMVLFGVLVVSDVSNIILRLNLA
ncbi:hypothetical protein ElyMa_002653300 [Elysia marginata]|uniref:G-protein coupled receptors family 1 profile domain-containing protein n=1 Tax=Elysia marginata TaxID=1093978 RepID=A0AAV4H8R6_9GAST|nr:hypothetical protein ElyMa_002653300 [Elysia marginata]